MGTEGTLTVLEAAREFRISGTRLQGAVERGHFPAVKTETGWAVRRGDIDRCRAEASGDDLKTMMPAVAARFDMGDIPAGFKVLVWWLFGTRDDQLAVGLRVALEWAYLALAGAVEANQAEQTEGARLDPRIWTAETCDPWNRMVSALKASMLRSRTMPVRKPPTT
jgi:hypothetical protein